MHNQISEVAKENYEEFEWDPSNDQVQCAAHKLALTVNAGLQALGIEAPPPQPVKSSMLENFPLDEHVMLTIAKE